MLNVIFLDCCHGDFFKVSFTEVIIVALFITIVRILIVDVVIFSYYLDSANSKYES